MRRRKPHHHVYVVELSKDVLNEPRFRKNNPGSRVRHFDRVFHPRQPSWVI